MYRDNQVQGGELSASIEKNQQLKNHKEKLNNSLHYYFNGYEKVFCEKFSKSAAKFIGSEIEFKLFGISDSPLVIPADCNYFVTQVSLYKEYGLVIKVSDTAAEILLNTALGERTNQEGYFKLKDLTEFEATVLSSLNEFLYKKNSDSFLSPKEIKTLEESLYEPKQNKAPKTVYLGFYISSSKETYSGDFAGRIIISFPEIAVKKPEKIHPPEIPVEIDFFDSAITHADIIAGYSRITLEDVKNLDVEDIIVLEKSNLYSMMLKNFGNMTININPSESLDTGINEENGETVLNKTNANIWDSLEVDMSAEFEKIKIRLGDLRQIVEGLVIDVASIAHNKMYINVDGKIIAAGELVIVGDKYGVKITEVFAQTRPAKSSPNSIPASDYSKGDSAYQNTNENQETAYSPQNSSETADYTAENDDIDDSDFDFSDYEIEEDI